MTLDRVRVQLTCTEPRERQLTIPAGTRFTQMNPEQAEYRTRRKATFGFWRRVWWRIRCWWAGQELPQTVSVRVERIG